MNRLQSNSAEADIPFKNLNVAAKIIKNFENKKISDEIIREQREIFRFFPL